MANSEVSPHCPPKSGKTAEGNILNQIKKVCHHIKPNSFQSFICGYFSRSFDFYALDVGFKSFMR